MNNKEILSRLSSVRVLVVGDVILDHYLWGDVNRISPEAPVPVVHVNRESDAAGGAANVALNLASLGVRTELIGCIGSDASGEMLLKRLRSAVVDVSRVAVSLSIQTIVKTRVMARTQQICRIDHESPPKHYCIDGNAEWLKQLDDAVAEADAVIISDYAKGVITQGLLNYIIDSGRRNQTLVSIDPKPSRRLNFRGGGLITPNRYEALGLAGIDELGYGEAYPLAEVASRIYQRYAPDILVVTLGAEGMAVCEKGLVVHTIPTTAREVFDVSGAGDTAIAALTAAIACGIDTVSATRFANDASGIVVGKMGTSIVTPKELIALGSKSDV